MLHEQHEQVLPLEMILEMETNDELRNAVAFAHGCYTANMQFKHKLALYYPKRYIVNSQEITIAKELLEKKRQQVLKDNKNNLLFVGMGADFRPTIENGVGNHRIRTEFLNSKGKQYFIEFGTCYNNQNLRIDHAIDRDKEKELDHAHDKQGEYYNYHDLERNTPEMEYTYKNILDLVNSHFGCNFKKMVVDSHNITCDNVLCKSL